MSATASQIIGVSIVCSTVCSGVDQRKEIVISSLCFHMQGHVGSGNPIMMTSSNGNIFRATGPFCEEFTGQRWIPRTKASDA